MRSSLALAALLLATLFLTRPAGAAGMYYSERGVRPLGRGGAFVAGADDLGAIAFNPAGLADAKSGLLLDPSWVNGQPAPSRYSLISMEGSALAILGAYVAFKPIEEIRIGAGFEALAGDLTSKQVFSASPQDRLLSAPESPEYDALATLKTK